MRIYTRGGDKGKTALFDGTRVAKTDLRVEAYGTVDELNATLSWARAAIAAPDLILPIERIQNELFTVGADLATPHGAKRDAKRVRDTMVETLERHIDRFMDEVGNPSGFVLPGETEPGSRLHIARTICRRAERAAVRLAAKERTNPEAIKYLNRLSDLLYAMAVWTDKVSRGKALRNPTYS